MLKHAGIEMLPLRSDPAFLPRMLVCASPERAVPISAHEAHDDRPRPRASRQLPDSPIDLAPGVAVTDLLGTISFDGVGSQNIVIPGATTALRVQLETSADPAWSVAFDNVFCDEP